METSYFTYYTSVNGVRKTVRLKQILNIIKKKTQIKHYITF